MRSTSRRLPRRIPSATSERRECRAKYSDINPSNFEVAFGRASNPPVLFFCFQACHNNVRQPLSPAPSNEHRANDRSHSVVLLSEESAIEVCSERPEGQSEQQKDLFTKE